MVTIKTRAILIPFILLAAVMALGSCSGGGGSAGVAPGLIVSAPAAPTTVYAVVSGQTPTVSVTVHWSSMPNATSYSVLRSSTSPTIPKAFNVVLATGLHSTLYSDTSVTSGTYYYAVKSVGSSGVSGLSAAAKAVVQTVAPGTALFTGTIQYEDKTYGIFGFTGAKPLKAVRYARVDLVSAASTTPVATTVTSPSGTFSFDVAANIGQNVYVSVEADAVSPAGEVVVKHMDTTLYAAKSASLNVMDGTAADLSLTVPANTIGGAFNIIDIYTSSAQFVSEMALTSVPSLTVFWPSAPNSADTYYCSPADVTLDSTNCGKGEGIYVLSDPPASPAYDTDQYDDDVLWHEYGHFIAFHFSKDDSPGGLHAFDINDYDLRLTWSEGWADFFQTAVKNWLFINNPALLSIANLTPLSQYVDTATTPGYFYISLNLGDPDVPGPPPTDSCTFDNCMYASNEVAVANVLWNLMTDPTNSFGMPPIWNDFASLRTVSTTSVSLEPFWDQWLILRSVTTGSTELTTLNTIYSSRSITYRPDGFEVDDTSGAASAYSGPQAHTLYSDATTTHLDVDYIAFNVASATTNYTVTTSNLRNGAATFVEILDAGLSVIGSGANAVPFIYANYCNVVTGCHVNGTGTLGSSVTFSAPTGTVYVRVTTSDSRPPSAGKYGAYTLTITP